MTDSEATRDPGLLFARAVVRKGLATREEVHTCLVERAATAEEGEEKPLADIMVERGFITRLQAENLQKDLEKGEATVRTIGPFELLTRLGSGGMGSVYLARDTRVDELLAVKLLSPELAKDREYLIRFQREVDSLSKVNHPNIVPAVDWGEAEGYYYLVMPFIQGENVFELLLREGALPERRAVDIATGVARALEHAHKKGFVHRDVKPENIIIALNGQALLTDLGLSMPTGRKGKALHVTQEGLVVGTCYYVSPEQASGSRELDVRSDFYSLGATMFHMSTGEVPYSGDSPAVVMTKHLSDPVPWAGDLNPALSDDFCHVVARLMAKDPAARYQTAAGILDDLDRLRRGEPVAARPRKRPHPRPRARPRQAPAAKPRAKGHLKKDLLWFGGGIGAGMVVVALGLAVMGGGGKAPAAMPEARKVDSPPRGFGPRPAHGVGGAPGEGNGRVLFRGDFEEGGRPWKGELTEDPRAGSARCARGERGEGGFVRVNVPVGKVTVSAAARVSFSYLCTGRAESIHVNLWNEARRLNYQYVVQPAAEGEWTRVVFDMNETRMDQAPARDFPADIVSVMVAAEGLREGELFVDDVLVLERE